MADHQLGGIAPPPSISISSSADADSNFPSSALENESALTVLSNLDEYWFWGNIVIGGLGSTGPISRSRSAVSSFGSSSGLGLSPLGSIEMVSPAPDVPAYHDNNKSRDAAELPKPYLDIRTPSISLDSRQVPERRHRRSLSDMPLDSQTESAAGLTFHPPSAAPSGSSPNKEIKHNLPDADKVPAQTPATSSAIKAVQRSGITRVSKLESIPSGKQLHEPTPTNTDTSIQQARLRRRERRKTSKSMTDLEFDELRGFMELGFRFNKDELSPHLVNMLPGLQRLGGQGKIQTPTVSRPYLSEAWLIRRSDSPLLNWRMPPLNGQGVDMKEHLKFWARAVASTVQQES